MRGSRAIDPGRHAAADYFARDAPKWTGGAMCGRRNAACLHRDGSTSVIP